MKSALSPIVESSSANKILCDNIRGKVCLSMLTFGKPSLLLNKEVISSTLDFDTGCVEVEPILQHIRAGDF